jgi:uncharacterized protein (DUF58 family)
LAVSELTFPLVPRRRLVGLAFGAMHSARRGTGSDVAGSRPYRPGDDVDAIDWAASARLSSAHGGEEFVVRERFAEEAPRIVVVCDRRPEMSLCPAHLPWLRKAEAMRVAVELIAVSAVAAHGFLGYLDEGAGEGEPYWSAPGSSTHLWEIEERAGRWPDFRAPADTVERSLSFLIGHRRSVPGGSFVFVLSDFLVPPDREAWTRALELRWDVVPVVIQDPVWEQSFPAVGGFVLPLSGPDGRVRSVRLSAAAARERRREHEARREALLSELASAGADPVLVSSSDPAAVLGAFLAWADERQYRSGRGW